MARWDLTGIFWDDYVAPVEKKVVEKRQPPEPVWLRPDYLPDLDTARAFKFNLFSDAELMAAQAARERLVWDIESYPNYFLIGFRSIKSEKTLMFELGYDDFSPEWLPKCEWVLKNFTLIGFNDSFYDLPMAAALLDHRDSLTMYQVSDLIINGGEDGRGLGPRDIYPKLGLKPLIVDHIDLLELTPLGPSLKVCAGRLHAPLMKDLPFVPGTELSPEQIDITRWYWGNDLDNTKLLYNKHKTAIELREILSSEYRVDVRSKSDPQIAEAVIRAEIRRIDRGRRIQKAQIQPGRCFYYKPASYLQFKTLRMQKILEFVCQQRMVVDEWGSPSLPAALGKLVVEIAQTQYNMGIGGLHSKEKTQVNAADDNYELTDNDVTSYYPSLIIQQGMYPPNVGPVFLDVFRRIYLRRLDAKRNGDKATSETLKIVLNGTFGKTGERGGHSVVYYPEMMIQVTLTGQLALLMLIEALELEGIPVVSANTDGIVIKCPRPLIQRKQEIIDAWQKQTGLEMESTPYKAVYSRDVNNYLAFYDKPKGDSYAKGKGAYAFAADAGLKVNPTAEICTTAIILWIAKNTPIAETIRACTDIRQFVVVRLVRGGAVKDGVYLGKAIRWYHAVGNDGEIINAKNGHTVPKSQGAKPCMKLPDSLPDDIDYEFYINRAYEMLNDFYPKIEAEEVKSAA
jgi:hypothetical protein